MTLWSCGIRTAAPASPQRRPKAPPEGARARRGGGAGARRGRGLSAPVRFGPGKAATSAGSDGVELPGPARGRALTAGPSRLPSGRGVPRACRRWGRAVLRLPPLTVGLGLGRAADRRCWEWGAAATERRLPGSWVRGTRRCCGVAGPWCRWRHAPVRRVGVTGEAAGCGVWEGEDLPEPGLEFAGQTSKA